jgi:hypothetical protein
MTRGSQAHIGQSPAPPTGAARCGDVLPLTRPGQLSPGSRRSQRLQASHSLSYVKNLLPEQ